MKDGILMTKEQSERDKGFRLFQFLREFSNLRVKSVRSIEDYSDYLWLKDIPDLPGSYCIARANEEIPDKDLWIEIHKPKFTDCPTPPKNILEWLDESEISDSSLDFPSLKESISEESQTEDGKIISIEHNLSDHPEIQEEWKKYIDDKWIKWADDDRIQQQVNKAYIKLYSIYKIQQISETYEPIFMFGYLTWRISGKEPVKHHLLSAKIDISFNPDKGIIAVSPHQDGVRLTLEQDMLNPEERPDHSIIKHITNEIEEIGDDVWVGDNLHRVSKIWINSYSESRPYVNDLVNQSEIERFPIVHFAPALIVRKRNERSLIRLLTDIAESIKEGNSQIPEGILDIVQAPDFKDNEHSEKSISNDDHISIAEGFAELFFPLPSNDEQKAIIEHLAYKNGVLVQGPPGTGKSHTIANLICHLLANGKRVLITSHTGRALEVLRKKMPQEIAPLCVVATGEDVESRMALEKSVQEISDRYNKWRGSSANKTQIDSYILQLNDYRKEEAKLLKELMSIRESETYKHSMVNRAYTGTLKQIAEQINQKKEDYGWISEFPYSSDDCSLNDDEAIRLLQMLNELGQDEIQETMANYPDPKDLPAPEIFLNKINEENRTKEDFKKYSEITGTHQFWTMLNTSEDLRNNLSLLLQNLINSSEELMSNTEDWVKGMMFEVLSGRERTVKDLLITSLDLLNKIDKKPEEVFYYRVTGTEEQDKYIIRANAVSLLTYLQNGGKINFFTKLLRKEIKDNKYLLKNIRINGYLCDNTDYLIKLVDWIDNFEHLERLAAHWNCYASIKELPPKLLKTHYEEFCNIIKKILNLRSYVEKISDIIKGIPTLQTPIWHNIDSIREFLKTIEAVKFQEILNNSKAFFSQFEDKIKLYSVASDSHPINLKLIQAIEDRNLESYSKAYLYLENLVELNHKLNILKNLSDRLKSSSPALFEAIKKDSKNSIWNHRLSSLQEAWAWLQTEEWLRKLTNPQRHQQVIDSIDMYKTRISSVLEKLAASKAWDFCLSKMTENELQSLKAWQMAFRRIGKKTGKYVNQYRKEARNHMDSCCTAIPAWIMPLYKVADTFKANPNMFDVVIIDEASQSGPEALFLHYIAKKMVVVGDDKQISPQSPGIDKNQVIELRNQWIKDLPFADAIGIEHSFFDLAYIRYQSQICLREHFRCMPEIIQFSNNLCYSNNPLIPLKQYGAGRLNPPVKTVYVREGFQRGKGSSIINQPEAEAVALQIKSCCEDTAYKGKTIGVISLRGGHQAKIIQQELVKYLAPEEMEKRQLRFGDPYTFQGDERDIIFLSMVAAPGDTRIGTLSDSDAMPYKKSYNVAASRARDQMWLFHSVTLNDLSKECLRYRLLEYCINPKVESLVVHGINIDNLRKIAKTKQRQLNNQPEPFDSWFEVDVFLRIIDKGYRVIPQVEIAGYHIDLIVEGIRNRLAVECDGDYWHGPDRYEADMFRQRQLERSGYIFWRIRASVFYLDPDKALESLWDTLEEQDIHPEDKSVHIDVIVLPAPSESVEVSISSSQIKEGQSINNQIQTEPTIQNQISNVAKNSANVKHSVEETKKESRGGISHTSETEPETLIKDESKGKKSKTELEKFIVCNVKTSNNFEYSSYKPVSFTIYSETLDVKGWFDLYIETLKQIYIVNKSNFKRVLTLPAFSNKKNFNLPKEILDSGVYVELSMEVNQIFPNILDILKLFDYHVQNYKVTLEFVKGIKRDVNKPRVKVVWSDSTSKNIENQNKVRHKCR